MACFQALLRKPCVQEPSVKVSDELPRGAILKSQSDAPGHQQRRLFES